GGGGGGGVGRRGGRPRLAAAAGQVRGGARPVECPGLPPPPAAGRPAGRGGPGGCGRVFRPLAGPSGPGPGRVSTAAVRTARPTALRRGDLVGEWAASAACHTTAALATGPPSSSSTPRPAPEAAARRPASAAGGKKAEPADTPRPSARPATWWQRSEKK